METKVNYAAVGLFVLILGAAFVLGVLWLASGALQTKYDLYLAFVDESVSGLNLSAPVKYSGVEVGKVRDLQLDSNNPERVRLTFAIKRGTPIKADTIAVLKTQGLTGIAYVELTGGSANSPPLRAAKGEYPEIQTKPSLSARLENLLSNSLAKLDSTSNSINAILSAENKAAFTSALADLSTVARAIAARKDTIDVAIANAARVFENGARASANLDVVIERVGRGADAIKNMGIEASRASASAGKTLESIGINIDRFSAETLPEVQRLLAEISVLTTSLRRLSEQTERNPRGLLFGQRSVGPGPGEHPGVEP